MEMEQRILRLERENRIQRAAILGIALLGAVLLLGAASSQRHIVLDHLEAHSVSVVSPDGNNRVDLYTTPDGFAGLALGGLDGKKTATLLVTPSGVPSLCLSDKAICRIVIGDVTGAQNWAGAETISIQTRNANGTAVWTAPAK